MEKNPFEIAYEAFSGILCGARHLREPVVTAAFRAPRKQQQSRRDEWLLTNRASIAAMTLDDIARAMKSAGLYSAKTSPVDIRGTVRRRCASLRISIAN